MLVVQVAEQDVVLLDVQVRVLELPETIEVGEGIKEAVGTFKVVEERIEPKEVPPALEAMAQ